MKLCRFELLKEPEQVRTGIVYNGRVYETDGVNAVAVHEADAVRPLQPVVAQSVRLFRNPDLMGQTLYGDEAYKSAYFYVGQSSLVGPSVIVRPPDFAIDLQSECYLGVVVAGPARSVEAQHADGFILGYTILTVLVARNELRKGFSARAFDFAVAAGPVVTTPDEIEGNATEGDDGLKYNLETVIKVNSVEKRRGSTGRLFITPSQALAIASESSELMAGDIIAIGPVSTWEPNEVSLEPGDEVSVSIEQLGTLSIKISVE